MMKCPYCGLLLVIEPINCAIIRCGGYFKNNVFTQFPQHAKKNAIDTLKKNNKYVGCGNPIKLSDSTLTKTNWNT